MSAPFKVIDIGLVVHVVQQSLHSLLLSPIGTAAVVLGLIVLALAVLRLALGIANFLWAYFLRPGRDLKSYGSWAVVTGATDGIGKAYAAALAKKGAPRPSARFYQLPHHRPPPASPHCSAASGLQA